MIPRLLSSLSIGSDDKKVNNEENLFDVAKLFVAQIPKNLNDELLNSTKEDILSLGTSDVRPQKIATWICRLPHNSRYQEGDEIKIIPEDDFMIVKDEFYKLTYRSGLKKLCTNVTFENKSFEKHFKAKKDFRIGTILCKNN